MKEVKTPKKPLAIYYTVVLLVLLLLNLVLVPWMSERQVKEVDYGTFMSMTEDKNIGRVDIESNQIIFTDKDETQTCPQSAAISSTRRWPFGPVWPAIPWLCRWRIPAPARSSPRPART